MSDGCPDCGGHSHGAPLPRRAAPARPLVRLRGAGVRHGENWAVHGIDLDVGTGEIVALIGPNGAGKSTLLRALAGLQPLTQGAIEWAEGKPLPLGYVPQQPALDRRLPISVEEFLRLKLRRERGWSWLRRPDAALRAETRAALDALGVGHLEARRLGALSGGELQRVLIAYALLGRPRLLLLDEPMTGIDVAGGKAFEELLDAVRRERDLAVLMVTHDLHRVGALADVVVCLNCHLCAAGAPAEVLQEHILSGIYAHPQGGTAPLGFPR
ncbi:MAG: metal ABC transporter ATP-binding protein [Verrucomicrobium sp.]|nr:metal ABC transporter ATP-binding protein [Verrucomicrobium sp.]